MQNVLSDKLLNIECFKISLQRESTGEKKESKTQSKIKNHSIV